MDMRKIKLIYSEKYNQYYKPIRVDEDIGIVYMQATKNRHDKAIGKSEIIRIEGNKPYQFVVMHDLNITAEQHFLNIVNSDCNPHVKISEIKAFKKNMLDQSEDCLQKLKELSESKPSKEDEYACKIQRVSLQVYRSLDAWKNCVIENNRKSYENQVIPKEIVRLALSKRLFIERRDDYCYKARNTFKRKVAPSQAKRSIQSNFPCGFLIRDKGGYVVAGKNDKYTLSVQEVIDFVNGYVPTNKHYRILYQVPMSERKERQLKFCSNILQENGLHYKNEHNYFFWVLDARKNVIAGGENGFGFKWLLKYCRRLRSQPRKNVTDKIQTSNSQLQISDR